MKKQCNGTFPWTRDKYVQMLRLLLETGEFDEKNVEIFTNETIMFNGIQISSVNRKCTETISCREWWLREEEEVEELLSAFEFTDDESDDELEDGDSGDEVNACDAVMNNIFDTIEKKRSMVAKTAGDVEHARCEYAKADREWENADRMWKSAQQVNEYPPKYDSDDGGGGGGAKKKRASAVTNWQLISDNTYYGDGDSKISNEKIDLWGKVRVVEIQLLNAFSCTPPLSPLPPKAGIKWPEYKTRKLRQNCALGLEWEFLVGEPFYIVFAATGAGKSDWATIIGHHIGFIRPDDHAGDIKGDFGMVSDDRVKRTASHDFTHCEWFLKDDSGDSSTDDEHEQVKQVYYKNPIEIGGVVASCYPSLYWVTNKKWAPLFEKLPLGDSSELRLAGWLQR